jgi:type IV secretory pathway VirB10-like protein
MNIFSRSACPCLLLLASLLHAADEEQAPRQSMKEILRARMAEDAQKQPAPAPKPSALAPAPSLPAPTTPPPAPTSPAAPAEPTATPSPAATAAAKEAPPAKVGQEPATVLPKVEVRKSRITVLDQQLALQEEAITRERKNLKPSEVDLALNDQKVAQPLAIFGGESAQFRKRVASERVELMEVEKDLLQAIALARTPKEKQELQSQLDQIRAVRRDLEKSLR